MYACWKSIIIFITFIITKFPSHFTSDNHTRTYFNIHLKTGVSILYYYQYTSHFIQFQSIVFNVITSNGAMVIENLILLFMLRECLLHNNELTPPYSSIIRTYNF